MRPSVLFFRFLLLFFGLFAEKSSCIDGYCFDCYDSSNGFPKNSVVAFAKNSDGYMFVASKSGIVRFDGANFEIPDFKSSLLLKGKINDFVTDNENNGYFATDSGFWVAKFISNGIFEAENIAETGEFAVVSLAFDNNSGRVFGAVHQKGIFAVSRKGGFEWISLNGLVFGSKNIKKIYLDKAGILWVGTTDGLYFRRNEHFIKVDYLEDSVVALADSKDGVLWVGGEKRLYSIENDDIAHTFEIPSSCGGITALFSDKDGVLWVGTKASGLAVFAENSFKFVNAAPSGEIRTVTSFGEDSDGELWFGTKSYGFCIAKKSGYAGSMFEDDIVENIVSDKSGNVWLNTLKSGIVRISPDGGKTVLSGKKESFTTIFVDFFNNIWASSKNSGLFVAQKNQEFRPVKDLFANSADFFPTAANIFFEDFDGSIFVNDLEKPSSFFVFKTDRTAERFNLPAGNEEIVDILQHDKKILIVTKNSGIFEYRSGSLPVPFYFSNNPVSIKSLFSDSQKHLWIITSDSKVVINLEHDTVEIPLNGSFGDMIYSVAEDGLGNFWLMSDGGVIKIDGNELESYLAGDLTSIFPIFYGKNDGIYTYQCSDILQNRAAFARNGMLYVPMLVGIALFDTNFVESRDEDIHLKIDRIIIDNDFENPVFVNDSNDITLPHSARTLEIFYSVPFFKRANALLFDYSYGMKSVNATRKRSAVFTDIPNGRNEFVLSAYFSKNSGDIAEKRILFHKPVKFYETTTFAVAAPSFAFILLLAFVFVSWRMKIMRKIEVKKLIEEKTIELQMKNNTLKEAVMKDPLTGLMNRRFLFDVEERKIKRFLESRDRKIHLLDNRILYEQSDNAVYAVIMMDIDNFKRVNDIYGHDVGDLVLKGVAEIMQNSVRADDILIRWGGEEFLIVLKNIPVRKLFDVAKNIRKTIENHSFETQNGESIWVTASMGLVYMPFFIFEPKLLSFENIITLADLALYHSKNSGRDKATFVVPGKNIPKTPEEIQGMLSSSEFAEINGFFSFEYIEPDNFSEFEIE